MISQVTGGLGRGEAARLRTTTPRSDQRRKARSTESTAMVLRVRLGGLLRGEEFQAWWRVCSELRLLTEMERQKKAGDALRIPRFCFLDLKAILTEENRSTRKYLN